MKQLLIMLMISLSATSYAAETVPNARPSGDALYENLTSNMACLCGCGTTLKTCPHETCSFAIPVRRELRGMVDKGMSGEEIKAAMVAKHGEAVLAQPMFRGFNTLAWIMPFAAIMGVGYLVTLIVRKWSAERPALAAKKPDAAPPSSDKYLERMRDELKKFEE